MFKAIALASVMSIGFVSATAFAGDEKKVEQKCDKDGKVCEKGDTCKPENCKK